VNTFERPFGGEIMDILEKLGRSIKASRKAAGLTQAKLAEMTELSDNFIALVERGQRSPSIHTLDKIAVALNVPLADLFQFEEDDPEKTNAEQVLRKLIEGRDTDEITFIADVSRFILSKLEDNFQSRLT
jgi:transcriptional regulator with XRE-family HTH domain